MTGVLETAAVGAVIATASTSLAAAGYGHYKGERVKLLTDVVEGKVSGPTADLPLNSLSKGPLRADDAQFSFNGRQAVFACVEFNGEILSVVKEDGTVSPCMALGGCNVTLQGTRVMARMTEGTSSVSLTFADPDEAERWAQEFRLASPMLAQHHRIQELIECVFNLENYINKDLRPRAKMCMEKEMEVKKLEKKLKRYEEDEPCEREKSTKGKEGPEGGSREELDCTPANVRRLMEEVQVLRGSRAAAPEVHEQIVGRLDTAEQTVAAKKAEVDAMVQQLVGRLDGITSDGSISAGDLEQTLKTKVEVEEFAVAIRRKLDSLSRSFNPGTQRCQRLENIAAKMEKRLLVLESTKEELLTQADLNSKAEKLENRLKKLEKKPAIVQLPENLEEKASALEERVAQLEQGKRFIDDSIDERSVRQQELEIKAQDLSSRLETVARRPSNSSTNGEGVAPKASSREVVRADPAAQRTIDDLNSKLMVYASQNADLQDAIAGLQARLQDAEQRTQAAIISASAKQVADGAISPESFTNLQMEIEQLKKERDAGVSMEAYEKLRQDNMTLRRQSSDQEKEAEGQKRRADLHAESNKDLQGQLQELRSQVLQARETGALDAALDDANAKLSAVSNDNAALSKDLQMKDAMLEDYVSKVTQLESTLQQAADNADEMAQLRNQDMAQFEQVLQERLQEKELEMEVLRAHSQEASGGGGNMNEVQQALEDLQAQKDAAEDRARQQEQELASLHDQLQQDANRLEESRIYVQQTQAENSQIVSQFNQVVQELETLKAEGPTSGGQAALEQQMLADRDRQAQELKAMQDKQDMLTKEFEAEYADIRRKQSTTVKQCEEAAQRAEIETRAKLQLLEEKQNLINELEQLRGQLQQQGNASASSAALQQRLKSFEDQCARAQAAQQAAETQLRDSNEREQQLSLKLRLFAQRDQQLEALQRQTDEQRSGQAAQAQAVQAAEASSEAAEAKARDYYQQVMQLSAENEQLKAEQGFLVKELEKPRADASPELQSVVTKLTAENSDLKNQLAATWAKINEQTKKIEEERSAFWEELEAVRLKAEPAAPGLSNSAPGNVSVPFTANTTSMPSTVQAASSPLTTGFGQPRGGIQRASAASGISRGNDAVRPMRTSAPGAGPRTVPTRAPADPQRTALTPQINSAARSGMNAGMMSGLQRSMQPEIVMERTAPSRR